MMAPGWRRGKDGWRGDEAGAVQAFEAVLAAVIILSALLLFALTQRPSLPEGPIGQDLGKVAGDALAILQSASPPNSLRDLVANALRDPAANLSALRSAIDGALPAGTKWVLSLHNGFASLPVAARDDGVFALPVSGNGATAYVAVPPASSGAAAASPGDPVGLTPACVKGPLAGASTNGPTRTWAQEWQATPGTVPRSALFGTWTLYSNADCATGASTLAVGLAGTVDPAPLYAVDLVVWTLG